MMDTLPIATLTKNRIESIDLLKGLAMVIMALDHTRDYFHADAFLYDPLNPLLTTGPVFFSRWITNFCAPIFCFLAGLSAFFVGKRKEKRSLSAFLAKRGLWLVIAEFTIVNFAWYFDIQFRTPGLLVIWSLGISMLVLSLLVYLPYKAIFIFSVVLILGHNLLDTVHFDGNVLWSAIHDMRLFHFGDQIRLYVDYPVVPWIAVMSLGYCFGELYRDTVAPEKRRKILNIAGVSAIVLFIIIRGLNEYGDPFHWKEYNSITQTLMSFFAVWKYPPSLCYLLMTLGPAWLLMANMENLRGRFVRFFSTFGRVPFFYYILHIYLIHLLAMLAVSLTWTGWRAMVLDDWVIMIPTLKGYGFNLWFVYFVWLVVIALLYPLCKRFDIYKLTHKKIWWLSYL